MKDDMSQRFYRLVPDIKEIFKQHKLIDQFPKLSDDNWLFQLAFVVDITFHLKGNLQLQFKLNLQLQLLKFKLTITRKRHTVTIDN